MFKQKLAELATNYPKTIITASILITIAFLFAFPHIKTDTDPVHMLPQNNPAVVLHNQMKETFNIHDYVVLAIHDKEEKNLFTQDGLTKITNITNDILQIRSKDKNDPHIIVYKDILSISTIDDIFQNNKGELLIRPLMPQAPQSENEAKKIYEKVNLNPILAGKLFSRDGSLIGIFVPLEKGKKDQSYYLGEKMKKIADKYLSDKEEYFLGGLPMAESTFGNEMFVQMAVYAPMAGLVIFLLMLFFFKSFKIVIAPMVLGGMTVIWSMGSLIYSGNTIHIMSSMIPIFLLPIAVLNSIHILSELALTLKESSSRKEAIVSTMKKLFIPMFYTSLTTIVGFASLATTGIPPVIVFGITIAFGVFLAWLLSQLLIPAYAMIVSAEALEKLSVISQQKQKSKILNAIKNFSMKVPGKIAIGAIVLFLISLYGLSKIVINDNPVRWFKKDHFLRIADTEVNKKLAGTYLTNLNFVLPPEKKEVKEGGSEFDDFAMEESDSPSIKDIEIVRYIEKVSDFLKTVKTPEGNPIVGDTSAFPDLLKKIGHTIKGKFELPASKEEVSQYMFLFESGDLKKGKDMWTLITPRDSLESQMWLYLKSGDNQNMQRLMIALENFQKTNPPPGKLELKWSGLVYINNVWQDSMVKGMGMSLIGSFIIVLFMMIFLFRSLSWGLIAMLPLTITIAGIYGMIGFAGKFYDMPIAVLSSLTLGLSIDFAIHFIEHARVVNRKNNDYKLTIEDLFGGTAQAIWRNILVIAIGFVPLFFARLVPYMTVGSFFFAIMLISGVTTLIIMPSLIKLFHKYLPDFKEVK